MCKIGKFFLKLLGVFVLLNGLLFVVFFFDLDGKLLFNVVEPFLKKHYDNMDRRDVLKEPYDMDKFPKYKYDKDEGTPFSPLRGQQSFDRRARPARRYAPPEGEPKMNNGGY